jgi:hypothetical protein
LRSEKRLSKIVIICINWDLKIVETPTLRTLNLRITNKLKLKLHFLLFLNKVEGKAVGA